MSLCNFCGGLPNTSCSKCKLTTEYCKKCQYQKHKCEELKQIVKDNNRKEHHDTLKKDMKTMVELHQSLVTERMKKENSELEDVLKEQYQHRITQLLAEIDIKDQQINELKKKSMNLTISFEQMQKQMDAWESSYNQQKMIMESEISPVQQVNAIVESEKKIKSTLKTLKQQEEQAKLRLLSQGKSSVRANNVEELQNDLVIDSAKKTLTLSKLKKNSLKKAISEKKEE